MKRRRNQAEEKIKMPSVTTEVEGVPPVLKSTRDEKPLHYTLKIQPFSLLKDALAKSPLGRYESQEFDAGGYKWKLALYPDGDGKRNGSDHISLYLVTVQDDILSFHSQVHVIFTFFVYDHIKDKYLSFQDGKVRHFDAIKTEWGFPQLLSLNSFNDASNGFLIDDCCVFGVEIFVMKSCDWKGEAFSMIKEPRNNKYTWKILNFSTLDKDYYASALFTVEGYNWKIELYPRGDSRMKGEALSIFLRLDNFKDLPRGSQVYVEYEVTVKNRVEPSNKKYTYNNWIHSGAAGWGHSNFISLKDLMLPSKGFILNDTLIVEAKINVISTLKSFS